MVQLSSVRLGSESSSSGGGSRVRKSARKSFVSAPSKETGYTCDPKLNRRKARPKTLFKKIKLRICSVWLIVQKDPSKIG